MKNQIVTHARWIGWILLGLYILLIVTAYYLQSMSGMLSSGAGMNAPSIRIILTGWGVIGVFLVSRRPQHPIGWIFVSMPVVFGLGDFADGYAYYGSISFPDSLPFVEAAIIYTYWTGQVLAGAWLTLLYLLFPTGRPMSRRWGILAWISITAMIVYILAAMIAPIPFGSSPFPNDLIGKDPSVQRIFQPLTIISFFGIHLCIFLSIFSLYLRLYRAVGIERQQLKWFAFSSGFLIPGVSLAFLTLIPNSPFPYWVFIVGILLMGISTIGTPVASAIAILRYRLYDIDIIIRRTLVYGILTGLLVLIYLVSVTSLQTVVTFITGQNSPLIIVLSTLGIVALFNPLRIRIQDFINRRFYRAVYNSERILQEFAVTAREEVDVDILAHAILEVVDSTMKPETISIWLKND